MWRVLTPSDGASRTGETGCLPPAALSETSFARNKEIPLQERKKKIHTKLHKNSVGGLYHSDINAKNCITVIRWRVQILRSIHYHLSTSIAILFTFRDFLISVTVGRIQIDTFDKFHIIQERVERHEVWKTDLTTALTGTNRLWCNKKRSFRYYIKCFNMVLSEISPVYRTENYIKITATKCAKSTHRN